MIRQGFDRDTHFPIDTNQPFCGAQLELKYKNLADDPARMALISLADIPYYHIASEQKCVSLAYPLLSLTEIPVGIPEVT